MDKGLVERVQKQHLDLEANLTKLRNALKHWQTLELDYEGLKDEFSALDDVTSQQDCLKAAYEFEPHKVDQKELIELIEPSKGKVRRPSQIVEVLSKRIEYVSKNIASLRDQITRVEKERNALLVAAQPEEEVELPVSEITEELDEDDNVISSKVQPQGDSASKVLDVLEKAKVPPKEGVFTENTGASTSRTMKPEITPGLKDRVSVLNEHDSDDESVTSEIISSGASKAAAHGPINPEDTEEEAQLRQDMLQYGLGEVGNIVAELDLLDGEDEDFDEEDIDMDDVSDFDDDDEYDDFSAEEESEDEDGRVKRSVHSEKYRKKMEELQKQLGCQLENVGPSPNLPAAVQAQIEHLPPAEVQQYIETLPPTLRKQLERPPAKEAARKAAIAREQAAKSSLKGSSDLETTKPNKKSKKKVTFATDLDFAPEPATRAKPEIATTSETVIERPSANQTVTSTTTSPPTKPSRFRAARSTQAQTSLFPPPMEYPSPNPDPITPSGPPHKTLSSTIIERPSPTSSHAPPPPDDTDFDVALQTRQIALEHHALRNKVIHDQGGYVQGGELENWGDEYVAPEIEDPRTGEVRRVSRFRAARMR